MLCFVHFKQDFLRLLPVADNIGMKRKLTLMLNRLNTQKAEDELFTDRTRRKVCRPRPMFVFVYTKPPSIGL